MEYTIKSGKPEKQKSACLLVGLFTKGRLPPIAAALDEASGGAIRAAVKSGDLAAKPGATLLLRRLDGVAAERVLLVSAGSRHEAIDRATFRKMAQGAAAALLPLAATEALTALHDLPVTEGDAGWQARSVIEAIAAAHYRSDQMKSDEGRRDAPAPKLQQLRLLASGKKQLPLLEQALQQGQALAAGRALIRQLADLPGNICTPDYLAQQARQISSDWSGLECEVLDQAAMEQLGMGSLLSVARGSRQPPRLIVLQWRGGAADAAPVVLVGKGLTFDAGGISLKPAAAMDEMKYDMCGGATVLGVMRSVAELQLPINLIGVVPASENLPDGNANKPGDIVTSMSGRTIEILNTDAEGRLILCDALTYCERFNPEVVIDMATLTGAALVALGKQTTALLGNDQPLIDALIAAGERSGDRAWQLPLWDEYQEQLKSPFADIANIGGRDAGTITAACFLSRFTRDFRWAHLDIAGTAWLSGDKKGATGRPLALLLEYLLNRVADQENKQ